MDECRRFGMGAAVRCAAVSDSVIRNNYGWIIGRSRDTLRPDRISIVLNASVFMRLYWFLQPIHVIKFGGGGQRTCQPHLTHQNRVIHDFLTVVLCNRGSIESAVSACAGIIIVSTNDTPSPPLVVVVVALWRLRV